MEKQNIDLCLRKALEKHTTEQLDLRLQSELQKEKPSEDLVLAIMDILQERESNYPEEITDTVLESWACFKKQCAEDAAPKKSPVGWKTLTSIAAGLLVLVLLSATIPKVLGAENIFQLIAQWTETVFSFSQGKENEEYVYQTDNPGLQQVHDTVTELGVTEPVVPMWVPEGAELEELKITELPALKQVYARIANDGSVIVLSFDIYEISHNRDYAKDSTCVKTIEIEGITHYVVSNDGEWKALWVHDNIECSLSVDCQENVLHKILYSIYYTEEVK